MEYTIVAEKEWVRSKGCYPSRVVLLRIKKGDAGTEYSTHVQIDYSKDKIGKKENDYLGLAHGHYYVDILGAAQDFDKRNV
jgi:hypothetical protein